MLTCPECHTHYPHGSLVCLNDGHTFVQNEDSRQMVQTILRGLPVARALELRVEYVDGITFSGTIPLIVIAKARLNGPPIRIGRRDAKASPTVFPEIDFHNYFVGSTERPPISRIHAVIEVIDNVAQICSASSVPTFVRRTGQATAFALTVRQYHELKHLDTIYLSSPEGRHIRLRVYSPAH